MVVYETPLSDGDVDSPIVRVHQPYATIVPLQEDEPVSELPRERQGRSLKDWKRITELILLGVVRTSYAFPTGWTFKAYDRDLLHDYEIPSNQVPPTIGAFRYIEHYNECGPYTRFRFQLCHNFLRGHCVSGFDCTYIHAHSLPVANNVHHLSRNAGSTNSFATLPPGYYIPVQVSGGPRHPQMIPSECILRTRGADRALKELGSSRVGHVPALCAHNLCNRGDRCDFIHSTLPCRHK